MSVYKVVKLTTGETLFAETKIEDDTIVMIDPIIVDYETSERGDALYGIPWMPFTLDRAHRITRKFLLYINELSPEFIKFYGAIMLRYELTKINNRFINQMEEEGGEPSLVATEMEQKMKDAHDSYCEKFGLEPLDRFSTKNPELTEKTRLLH
jgi:hypothetical protein